MIGGGQIVEDLPVAIGPVSLYDERQLFQTSYWHPITSSDKQQELLSLAGCHIIVYNKPELPTIA